MALVRSLSVGNGDMFYISHGSDSFTIIDCCLGADNRDEILEELKDASRTKGLTRFVSTHPDEDHIQGLPYLDQGLNIRNFYCVPNNARKTHVTESFRHYCHLRDNAKVAFHVFKGCKRRWMNQEDEQRGGAGLSILWPDLNDANFKQAQRDAYLGTAFNNLSLVMRYKTGPASFMWIGDLETDFMEAISDNISLQKTTVVFAPHHGRDSGKIPDSWLKRLDPQIIVIGEAPSRHLHYYTGYQTITQNRAGNISFLTDQNRIHVYASNPGYDFLDFCENERLEDFPNDFYVGTLPIETKYTL